MNENCIFCKIIKNEIPSKKYFENDNFLAIFDINPIAENHLILMSKNHYENINQMDDKEWCAFMFLAKTLAEKIVNEIKAEGYNLLINQGEAGQSLVKHRPHCHIVPRFLNDKIKIDPRNNA